MKRKHTFGIAFITRKSRVKNESYPIFARITIDGSRVEISTQQYIPVLLWDSGRGMAKGRSSESKTINTFLERFRGQISEVYQELLLKDVEITAEIVKNTLLGNTIESKSLLELFDYHNSSMENSLAWGTLKNYFTTKKYFENYIKKVYKRSDLKLTELDYRFLTGYESFMKSTKPLKESQACNQNTIMKHIERLRKVVNLAIKYEWLDRDPFIHFSPTFIRKERDFLTKQELDTIEQKQFDTHRLSQVKDLFVFSCYTGLSYIDVYNLKAKNLIRGIDGEIWLQTYREKNKQPVNVPLLPKALKIIKKYETDLAVQARGKLMPSLTNQNLNSYLKEIADVCNINKNLTFHMARHTFATTVTLTNGVPIETVSKLLGHTSIRTTQIYARVINEKVSNDMKLLREKLEYS